MKPTARHDNVRTLVLTGASRGIGHATVKKFNASGWRVITISRQPFSALCPWPGGGDNHVQLDIADPVDIGRGATGHRINHCAVVRLRDSQGVGPIVPVATQEHAHRCISRLESG